MKGPVTVAQKHVHGASGAIAVALAHRQDVEFSISIDIAEYDRFHILPGCVADRRLICAVAIAQQNGHNTIGAIIWCALARQNYIQFAVTIEISCGTSERVLTAGR